MIYIRDDVPYKGRYLGLNGTYQDLDQFLRVVHRKMVQAGAAKDEISEVVKDLKEHGR